MEVLPPQVEVLCRCQEQFSDTLCGFFLGQNSKVLLRIGTRTEPRCGHLGRRPEEVHLSWFFVLSSVESS